MSKIKVLKIIIGPIILIIWGIIFLLEDGYSVELKNLQFIKFKYEIKILEKHLDTLGHVNNAVYLQLLEEARWDFITERGFGIDEVLKRKIGPIIISTEIKYRRELKNRESITIESYVVQIMDRLRYKLKQVIYCEGEKVAAEALFVMGFMDLEKRKLVNILPEFMVALGATETTV
ncbi:MAG: acyl-CoA thioesterase [Oligoflexia bacterium]|nr:acyl-CoA thioesterase [Oligoflexia bacterium]